ncbi:MULTISPECIES: bifunctional adenosylcobinamide kinase/adenosylcobinamide-phosphate guanylyltransferase [Paenibacillus]|uniref:Adenosylcobinamide kinase n=1 Tax=Paenibacillus lactis 154 TaxID=743719 RepID=G4H7S1_9BACL|nr:bifunctional adenosylcobinamide kinase/adenosylcobinamide-phosphate guanylyltransferase [Paenibacillus lactis]EHB67906.1 Adenosylcobinamide-phosphate guanylyltransferase [Paenibacillus lactis 154]MCM3493088.1 bifunctional adenosylcobinamide kinase/adenosylcobinamide-phosphate guanylyltransferase [Paenibacillus lactis]GIO89794.1 adenosylcobinamide kinase/adenosylcobinamide phosphate guanyltransferase [Paenibacillus lactis]
MNPLSSLVTGGARSGKSSFAEKLCMKRSSSGLYIATAQAYDDEMKERIRIHQDRRSDADYRWETVEEPVALPELLETLGQSASDAPAVVVDCLTLWLTNVLLQVEPEGAAAMEERLQLDIGRLARAVQTYPGTVILVTNEVGSGIVPEYPLGRIFRDWAGMMNQRLARICHEVFLVTAGIPMEIKSREYRI